MIEIKCCVCGATPDESEDIYGYLPDEPCAKLIYVHRHPQHCIDYLKSIRESLQTELENAYSVLTETQEVAVAQGRENKKLRDVLSRIAVFERSNIVSSTVPFTDSDARYLIEMAKGALK